MRGMTEQRRVDRASYLPAYRQLADILRGQILSGELIAGSDLPSEAALAAEHQVSRTTVTQAMTVLRTEGLVVSERGRLSRVRPVRVVTSQRYAASKDGYGGPDAAGFEAEHGVAWSEFEIARQYRVVAASSRVANALGVSPGTQVYERRWLHKTGGVALRVSWSYLVAERFAGTVLVDEAEAPWPGGTIAQLRSVGHDVTSIRTEVTARTSSAEEQQLLQMPAGGAVMEAWRVQSTADGPVECAQHIYPAGAHVLVFETPVGPAPAA
jgi:GntR family transcriptional regulator